MPRPRAHKTNLPDVATSFVGRAAELAAIAALFDDAADLGRALARRGPMLLVLDNFEQLAQGGSPLVRAWLQAAPRLRLLVTSRVALDVAEEHILPVPPLARRVRPEAAEGEVIDGIHQPLPQ